MLPNSIFCLKEKSQDKNKTKNTDDEMSQELLFVDI